MPLIWSRPNSPRGRFAKLTVGKPRPNIYISTSNNVLPIPFNLQHCNTPRSLRATTSTMVWNRIFAFCSPTSEPSLLTVSQSKRTFDEMLSDGKFTPQPTAWSVFPKIYETNNMLTCVSACSSLVVGPISSSSAKVASGKFIVT